MENDFTIEEIASIEQLEDFDEEYVYDIEVDDETHTFIANDVLVHNSCYTTYGSFFECFTDAALEKYPTDMDKIKWILKFNKEFLDSQNTEWISKMYNDRHAKSIHNFEIETISLSGIYLKKKKYLKALSFNKGKFYDDPKISGTGIEIIKSTTPKLCREILTDLIRDLLFNYDVEHKEEFVYYFNNKLSEWHYKFKNAPLEDISESISVGEYKKYVVNDKDNLIFAPKAPKSVKAAARYNYLAHQNGQDNLFMSTGKIKYYNIKISKKDTDFFGYPAGELPDFAPQIDMQTQWQKTVINPINRFLIVMNLPEMNSECLIQPTLFGF